MNFGKANRQYKGKHFETSHEEYVPQFTENTGFANRQQLNYAAFKNHKSQIYSTGALN